MQLSVVEMLNAASTIQQFIADDVTIALYLYDLLNTRLLKMAAAPFCVRVRSICRTSLHTILRTHYIRPPTDPLAAVVSQLRCICEDGFKHHALTSAYSSLRLNRLYDMQAQIYRDSSIMYAGAIWPSYDLYTAQLHPGDLYARFMAFTSRDIV